MASTQPELPIELAAAAAAAAAPQDVEGNKKSKDFGLDPQDPYLVKFEEPFDRDNPLHWSLRRKWAVTNVLSATGFNRILVSTVMAPALSSIAAELDMSNTESVMALSIYLLATAFGPLIAGPLSEVYGRQVVLHASNVWFLVWNILCGFATNKETLIAARFLTGFGASSIYALAGGVLGDVWHPHQRGKSLGIYLLIPLCGAAVGPIVGGFMTDRTTWRWMFWSTSAFQAVMIVYSFTTFRETFAPVILKRRAARLHKETGDNQYQTRRERDFDRRPIWSILARALSRPLRLLAFHPIIQVQSLISAFDYGVLYIALSSFADIWIRQYGQRVDISGLHYIAIALGEIVASQLGGKLMDLYYRRVERRSAEGQPTPEQRIPLVFPGAVIAPIGLVLYGWAAQYRLHWIVVDVGIFLACFGMQISGMPMQAYVIDVYPPETTSSALAASQLLRSLFAFLFPLFTPTMYHALGYGWGNTTVAVAGLVFMMGAPLVVMRYGERLRAKATGRL